MWKIFIQPYFIYTAYIIDTQSKLIQEKAWRSSFKRFLNIPLNLGNNILTNIFEDIEAKTVELQLKL